MEECQKGANLGLKCVRMRLAARLCPDPLRVLEHSPRPHSCNSGEGRLLLREREGNGKSEGEGRKGKGGPPSRIRKVQRWQPYPLKGCEPWWKVMAAYRRVYDSRHLQAECQEPGSASEP